MNHELASLRAALRAYRERVGMTQRQLADQAGVSVRAIRAIERGQVSRPHAASLRMLASVVGQDGDGDDDNLAPTSCRRAHRTRPTTPPASPLWGNRTLGRT
ncbi:helix-turn-helix transcriptional regulator [Lentzea sp. NPDC005914]|uniref:helix-turn-helix domain-containing protein n=1 Tax=Lentzea sp. NPDC005914 TaxID=3154572 RepID=UPI0033D31BBC